ncbi:hypothetical protein AB834_01430 [PVC group bacterium (ex Bugula neritina AB1)]|nr:hypothetical protein AB834_01430 [PVC group bacterium (ex Bugula neritina AB1)]
MPCRDTRAIVEFCLNNKDQLLFFDFHKDTCQKEIGSSRRIIRHFRGCSVEMILETPFDAIPWGGNQQQLSDEDSFLHYMQWRSLQMALQLYTGRDSFIDECRILSVDWDDSEVKVRSEVLPPADMPKVQACSTKNRSVVK